MKLLASAPGRICLFGEHMDWVRHAVIPAAIELRIFLMIEPIDGTIIAESYPPFTARDIFKIDDFDPLKGGDLKYIRATVKAFLNKGYKLKGARIRLLKSNDIPVRMDALDLPAKKGLSSSAALCVATAGALYALTNKVAEEHVSFLAEIADIAYTAERKILGINCGQMDQYASAFGGLLYIDCSVEPAVPQPLALKTKLPIVIGDTQQPKDTPRILAWLGRRFQEKEPFFMEGVRGIVEVVEEAKKELMKETVNIEKIGKLMNLNQYYLSKYLKVSGDCPISPNNLDKLIEAALSAGALGAKLTGSGGGGAMIALCRLEDINKVAKAIERVGGKAYKTRVAEKGLMISSLKT